MRIFGFVFSAAVAAMLAAAQPSSGQTANAAAQSGAQANSGSASQSASVVTYAPVSNAYQSAIPTSTEATIRTAPMVYAPNIVGGNLCAVGASAGASWLGAGFSLGASWESDNCERRQLAAMMYNAGNKEASKELLCDHRPVYEAMKRAGTPCQVRERWEDGKLGPPTPVAAPVPVPVRTASSFDPALYRSGADCLTAAQSAGAPLALCRGKP